MKKEICPYIKPINLDSIIGYIAVGILIGFFIGYLMPKF